MRRLFLCGCCLLLALSARADGIQNLGVLEKLAEQFLKRELGLREASWKLGQLDRRLAVPACAKPKAEWANPAVTTGATAVLLSCPDLGWTLRLPVMINEKRLGVALNRAVAPGEQLTADDVRLVEISNPALASNVLTDASQAVGQVMRSGAPSGAWLRNFMVRAPYLVRVNQQVKVSAEGEGFAAEAEGMAMGNAALGEQVNVRLSTGRVVRGMVRQDGSVAVVF
ncbi:flagellar basal body P-ring formation chaperone FlgA [Chromobacterium amazonense]|uniref:Flagella basal body P-ring formation protein FlgA n=1 Tax=Chromobacterium amazonense TaxID=1382803 RepID=A0A2S9X845_9NEIS|nr:flagellar basal body P-ring formation chaperone FlgA [Chromobacterium amazonense]MBM2882915.1 flagellar basal body P-ring formation protein FlgA [Chromobacterium amazonense]MDE1713037.1 flagellar basal body P-ring formation chaperone FlgA [Chromobacterium amazonense]PRP71892.1 flagella basal body P-ring formation protein FlgA [Chromobacterium amazonense]